MASLLVTGVALATAVAVWTPTNTFAQVKGAQLLAPPRNLVTTPAAAPAMACASCKSEYSSKVDTNVRGAIKPTVRLAQHLCGGCSTAVTTTGVGKTATTVASHSCSMDGKPANCCN